MSFSIYASGTRDDTLASLAKMEFTDTLGPKVRDLITESLADAASEGMMSTEMLRYEVTASGHAGDGDVFSLTVNAQGRYMDKSGGPAVTTDAPA